MLGLDIARVYLFFSFKYNRRRYACAFVRWFERVGNQPDPATGMWIIKPRVRRQGRKNVPVVSVIHINTIYRAAHLIGVPSPRSPIPLTLEDADSLDWFTSFYVNKYIDHHAFETLHQ